MFNKPLRNHSFKLIRVAVCVFFSLHFTDSSAVARGCVALTIQQDRSPGASIIQNDCDDLSSLSLGAMLQMNGGARLWLKSISDKQLNSGFQIICQNKSLSPLQIEVSSSFIPWIKPKNLAQCNNWEGDRLICNQSSNGNPVLYCAIAKIKNLDVAHVIQRKTSVTMRGIYGQGGLQPLDKSESEKLEKSIEFIKSEVDLCRKVFQTAMSIHIAWTISADGEVINAASRENGGQKHFAECALEAVEHFNFPMFSKDIQISYTF